MEFLVMAYLQTYGKKNSAVQKWVKSMKLNREYGRNSRAKNSGKKVHFRFACKLF